MKAIFTSLVGFFIVLQASAQSEARTFQLNPAQIVNFSQLAARERLNPPKQRRHFIEQGEDREKESMRDHKPNTLNAVTENRPLPAGLRSPSPAPLSFFNGIMDNGNIIPPDIRGAAGTNYLVQTTNQQINIFNKTGSLHSSVSLDAFFASAGGINGSYFDPHIEFDPIRQRFLACIGGNLSNFYSGVFLAISETSDPTGNWYVYAYDGTGNGNDLLDFPLLGYNNKWVVITGNDYTSMATIGKIFVVNRDSVYNGFGGRVHVFVDNNVFTLAPACTLDTMQTVEYMVQNDGSNGGLGYVQICTITGTPSAPVYTAGSSLAINHPWSDNTPGAPQSGTSNRLEDGDARIDHAVYINGSMWFCHTVGLPQANATRDAVDWWQIDPSVPSTLQFGRIQDITGVNFYFYPSLQVNEFGDVLLGYCQSSSQMFPSASYSFRAVGDPLNTMHDPFIFKPGVANYYKTFGGSRNRWGDYTGMAVDPVNQSFWNFGEWANTGNNWGTCIANVLASSDSTCYEPLNLSSTEVTDTSVRLAWQPVSPASYFIISYSVSGSGTWVTDTSLTTAKTITGLTGATLYDWTVQSICLSGDTSVTAMQANFMTRTTCAVPAPSVTPGQGCAGSAITLSASGSSTLTWYADPVTNVVLDTGSTFITPSLSSTTVYYVESVVEAPSGFAGPVDSTLGGTGTGGYATAHTYHYQLFNCYNPIRIKSVLVYAQIAGNRTITLKQNGSLLQSRTVSMPAGASRVALDFDVQPGSNYELGCQGNIALYRNVTGASYPYNLNGVLSIIGNDVDTGYYFYFYDWELREAPCLSLRLPVAAVVDTSVLASFHAGIAVDTVYCTDSSTAGTSWFWTFGDAGSGSADTSYLPNPYHVYTIMDSAYTICLTVSDSVSGCSSTTCQQVLVGGVGIPEIAKDYFSLYPNPANGYLNLEFGKAAGSGPWILTLSDMAGREVIRQVFRQVQQEDGYVLDISGFSKGSYFVTLQSGEKTFRAKVMVQ